MAKGQQRALKRDTFWRHVMKRFGRSGLTARESPRRLERTLVLRLASGAAATRCGAATWCAGGGAGVRAGGGE